MNLSYQVSILDALPQLPFKQSAPSPLVQPAFLTWGLLTGFSISGSDLTDAWYTFTFQV